MTETPASSPPRIASLAGSGLIIIGSCQLAYSVLAIASAWGMGVVHMLLGIFLGLAETSHGAPEGLSDTDIGLAYIESSSSIAILGIALTISALVAGIQLLKNGRYANGMIVVVVLLSFVSGYRHLLISFTSVAMLHFMIGLLYGSYLIFAPKRVNPHSPRSSAIETVVD